MYTAIICYVLRLMGSQSCFKASLFYRYLILLLSSAEYFCGELMYSGLYVTHTNYSNGISFALSAGFKNLMKLPIISESLKVIFIFLQYHLFLKF